MVAAQSVSVGMLVGVSKSGVEIPQSMVCKSLRCRNTMLSRSAAW